MDIWKQSTTMDYSAKKSEIKPLIIGQNAETVLLDAD